MDNISDEKIAARILNKMARHGWWEAKHTSINNLPKGMPKHLWKDVRKVIDELIRKGFIKRKPTSYGLEVSLNIKMKNEIFRIIEKYRMND